MTASFTCLATLGSGTGTDDCGFRLLKDLLDDRVADGDAGRPAPDCKGGGRAAEPDGVERDLLRAIRRAGGPSGEGEDQGLLRKNAHRLRQAPAAAPRRALCDPRRLAASWPRGPSTSSPTFRALGSAPWSSANSCSRRRRSQPCPASAFGAEGYLRLSYATSDETITKGVAQAREFLQEPKGLRRHH